MAKETSPELASLAAKILGSDEPVSLEDAKRLAASVLSQREPGEPEIAGWMWEKADYKGNRFTYVSLHKPVLGHFLNLRPLYAGAEVKS